MVRNRIELQHIENDLKDNFYWGDILNVSLPPVTDYRKWDCYGIKRDGMPVVAWSYHSYIKMGNSRLRYYEAEMSIASFSPNWATKGTIKLMLALFFYKSMYNRLTALITSDNRQAVKLVELAGFTQEGIVRQPTGLKEIKQFSLLKEEWKKGRFSWE